MLKEPHSMLNFV